jgi:hypothetical protein
LGHLVADAGSGGEGLVLVDPVDGGGYQVADVAVVGVVHDGDELDARLAKVGAGDGGVLDVAVQSRPGVDDDQVNIPLGPDARHHLHDLRLGCRRW